MVRFAGGVIDPLLVCATIENPVVSPAGSITLVTMTWPFFTLVNVQVTVPPAGTAKLPGVPLSQLEAVRSQPAGTVSDAL